MNLRPRQIEKEIGPGSFRFQPNNYIEKISDHIIYQNPTLICEQKNNYTQDTVNKFGDLLRNFKPVEPNIYKNPVALESQRENVKTSASIQRPVETSPTPANTVMTPPKIPVLKLEELKPNSALSKYDQSNRNKTAEPLSRVRQIQLKTIAPKQLLPKLHQKTHFKAAYEYCLGEKLTHRSLHDNNLEL